MSYDDVSGKFASYFANQLSTIPCSILILVINLGMMKLMTFGVGWNENGGGKIDQLITWRE